MSLENIKIIGFDLDNTLYPSTDEIQERIRRGIYERLSGELNISVKKARELFEENYNGDFAWSLSGSRTINEIGRRYDKDLSERDIVQESIEKADILDLIQPNPALVNMLRRLNTKYCMDLITSTTYDLARGKLERIGIRKDFFEYFLTASKFGRKGDGTVYEYWLRERGVSPKAVLYVGDNKKQDIDSPKALGINTCFVNGEYGGADYCIGEVLELERLVCG